MNENTKWLALWLARAVQGVVLLATASCAQLAATGSVSIPPIPAGESRVWFCREWRICRSGRVRWRVLSRCSSRALPRDGADGRHRRQSIGQFRCRPRPGGLCKNRLVAELGYGGRQKPVGAADVLRPANPEPSRASRCCASLLLRRELSRRGFRSSRGSRFRYRSHKRKFRRAGPNR